MRRISILAATAAALALAACGGATGNTAKASSGPTGTLTIATPGDILTMDPAMHRSRDTENVIREVFNGLVNEDNSLQPVPELATAWHSTDPLTWVFDLRHGVQFSNGDPFTADDVKFTIDRILDPAQKSPRASLLPTVDNVTVQDQYTVAIHTKTPTANLLQLLAVQEIVPKKYVQQVGDAAFAKSPIGTGPFLFKSWTPNQQVVLTANPHYWAGAPKVATLIFRPIPEVATRVAALQSGEVQIAAQIPADIAKTLTGTTKVATDPGTNVYFLAMNVKTAPFNSLQVRQGVNYAVDQAALVSGLYGGQAEALNQPMGKSMVGYVPSFAGYKHDLDKAKSLLAGVPAVQLDARQQDLTLAQAVAGQLQAAGLKVSVNSMETAAMTSSINSGKSAFYLYSWGVSDGDADSLFSVQFATNRQNQVFTAYSDPQLDTLIQQGRSTLDKSVRNGYYAQATKIVTDAAVWAPLLIPQDIYGVSASVKDWQPSSVGRYNVAATSISH